MSVDIDGMPVRVGEAQFHRNRGALSATTFQYDPAYLRDGRAYPLDPALPLVSGSQYVAGLPGAFADCSPDRWGRNLIIKQERAAARRASRREAALDDVDFLVGVSDITRQGALRFRVDAAEPFVAPGHAVPKLIALPDLLHASEVVVGGSGVVDDEQVKALLSAGSGSLGGARPKASVAADDGRLLIAKFPHPGDDWDVLAWEATTLDLAAAAGVTVPRHRLVRVGGRRVLLLERFDRSASGMRIGYMSAMTLLEAHDGDAADYADVADRFSGPFGARVDGDLRQWFRRAVVNVGVHNTDDHPRNHGFLRARGGWILSPAFDVNPDPQSSIRQMAIAGADEPSSEPSGLAELASACRLSRADAADERARVASALATWRDVATANGVRSTELARFAPVFAEGIAAVRR